MAANTKTTPPEDDIAFFAEVNSAEIVNARIDAATADPRLAEIVSAMTRHLHAFVKEVDPTSEEWLTAIRFLTAVGHTCTDWRQEFILLSDVLGVSSLVDAINSRRPNGATENTILGPFYVLDAPLRANGDTICLDGKGEKLLVRGRVTDSEGTPIAGAVVDVWQTSHDGFYDVQQRGVQPEMNMRGRFQTDADGRFRFRSSRPRFYPIPDDGPVGALLGHLGRHPNRAAHIHAIVSAPGFDTVVTHIFDPDCTWLRDDAVFGVKASLIAHFTRIDDAARVAVAGFTDVAWFWDVEVTFVLTHGTCRRVVIHQV